jgi:hypothetical protein
MDSYMPRPALGRVAPNCAAMSQTLYKNVSLSNTISLSPTASVNVPSQVIRATSGMRQLSPSPDADGMVDISFR